MFAARIDNGRFDADVAGAAVEHIVNAIAEFLGHLVVIARVNGIYQLINFLDGVLAEREMILLTIPRAAVGGAQSRAQPNPFNPLGWIGKADSMAAVRAQSDALELTVGDDFWPLPRYREMLRDVLASNRLFAVAGLDSRRLGEDGLSEPPHRIATVGIVRACQKNGNGTSNLLLQGVARVEITHIVADAPYRRIRVRALASEEGPITLIPAAVPDWQHVEDEIACQAVATALEGFTNLPEFVRECAESARERILASPRPGLLAKKISTGADDVKIALDIDRVGEQVLALEFVAPCFAEVRNA